MDEQYEHGFGRVEIMEIAIPSGKRLHNYGKIHPFFMGKSTIDDINGHFQ